MTVSPRDASKDGCYCGFLGWTVKAYGRETHKHGCPARTEARCQQHPQGCPVAPRDADVIREARGYLTSHESTNYVDPCACSACKVIRPLVARVHALEQAAEKLEAALTWERKEHDKARDEWLDMRARLNGLHQDVASALSHTKPPESWRGTMCHYGGPNDIIADPYSWLAVLIAEALDEHPAAETYDDEATRELHERELARAVVLEGAARQGKDLGVAQSAPCEGSGGEQR